MGKEIKKRKKRFWTFCLAMLLLLCDAVPIKASAAEYKPNEISNGDLVQPGDTIGLVEGTCQISYRKEDGTTVTEDTADASKQMTWSRGTYYAFTVRDYEQAFGSKPQSGKQLKAWKVTSIQATGGLPTSIALTPVLENATYNIYYHLDGGTNNAKNPITYTFGTGVTFADPDKTGYSFEGWFTDASFLNKVTNIPATETGDVDLYAKFAPITYNITYQKADASDTSETNGGNPSTYQYTDTITLKPAVKHFYDFSKWSKSGDTSETPITQIKNMAEHLILIPHFTPKWYEITYQLDGGSHETSAAETPSRYQYTQGVTLGKAQKEHYTFDGWYKNENFQGSPFEEIPANWHVNITLWAKYTPKQYGIQYYYSDGTEIPTNNLTGAVSTYTYNTEQSLTGVSANKEYYTFDGWCTDAACTTPITAVTAGTSGSIKVYAKFKPKDYTITYSLGTGETNGTGNPQNYTYGVGVTSFAAATKNGYTFLGWYSDQNFADDKKVTSILATDHGAITLYPKFQANTYTIEYKDASGTELTDLEKNGNVNGYTYGTGVTLRDAVRQNYTFDGWYANADFTGNKVTSISGSKTENVTLYAKFEPKTYTITYYNVDAASLNPNTNPTEYTYGTGVAQFYDCQKEGYTFGGWYTLPNYAENAKVITISPTTVGNYYLYAKFTPQSRTITYVLDGGTNSSENPSSYTIGTGVSELKSATKLGYTFNGWYSDASFTTEVTGISGTQMENVTLYAKFTANRYQITYELDGGTNASANPTAYTYGTGVSSFASATKSGYTFNGWYSDASFTNRVTSIPADRTGNVALYARFTRKSSGSMGGGSTGTITEVTYEIEYKLDGGSNAAVNPEKYTYGTGIRSFADASKNGYMFDGWYSDALFTTRVTRISVSQIGKVVLYAKFIPDTYRINYVLNNGINPAENPSMYTYGTGVEAFADADRTGYTFDGWYSDASCTAKVTGISDTMVGEVTLYAKFTPAVYEIAYETDGGTNAADNPAFYTYGIGVKSFADAVKTGYTFDGWYSDVNFTRKVTDISEVQTGKITLYAKFTPETYPITYVLNNGTNAAANPASYTYGTGVKSFADAERKGCHFNGWYADASFQTRVSSISETRTGEMTLYAKFTGTTYTITYELDGGTNGAGNPEGYTFGTGLENLAPAEKNGYTFDGWYTDKECTKPVTSISGTQTGNVTLYAKFSPIDYNIVYELNGGANGTGNPAGYVYGVGVIGFADAEKTGFTFDGWYADADFTAKVTGISGTQTGTVHLYAKFTEATYTINYELDGGTNGAGNPAAYIYGTGLKNLEPAEKDGYTFDGWYTDAECTVRIKSIPETLTENITLYAKFTPNPTATPVPTATPTPTEAPTTDVDTAAGGLTMFSVLLPAVLVILVGSFLFLKKRKEDEKKKEDKKEQ